MNTFVSSSDFVTIGLPYVYQYLFRVAKQCYSQWILREGNNGFLLESQSFLLTSESLGLCKVSIDVYDTPK